MSKLKIITTDSSPIFIIQEKGEDPTLAYKNGGIIVKLNKGGSPNSRLLSCSDLYKILSNWFIKDTKFIISTYNPVLYYLFPGTEYDKMFNPSTNFIPTLDIPSLVRGEVVGYGKYEEIGGDIVYVDDFSDNSKITQDSIKSIKACDSWSNNPAEEERAIKAVNERASDIFKYYENLSGLDWEKEVRDKTSGYSVDLMSNSLVVVPLSDTTYTDTINLEDWALKSGNSDSIKAKVDISFMYSYEGQIIGGTETIEAFRYSGGNLISQNVIIPKGKIRIEYINWILKIYPVDSNVDEVIFSDCVLTIGT